MKKNRKKNRKIESYSAQDLLELFSSEDAVIIDFKNFEKVVARTMELYYEQGGG